MRVHNRPNPHCYLSGSTLIGWRGVSWRNSDLNAYALRMRLARKLIDTDHVLYNPEKSGIFDAERSFI